MNLPFQAVECYLDGLFPVEGKHFFIFFFKIYGALNKTLLL